MLRSRLATPGASPGVVVRASLFARLSAAGSGVTLLSAPAGAGKTVLLRSWLAAQGLWVRAGWVTVDRGEGDAQRFWLQVVEALRSVPGVDDVVQPPTPTPEFDGDAFADRLLADLAGLEDRVILVIDDLHELTAADAQAQLERLLARRPPRLAVILATRHDPQLGLHRLRLTGELSELRDADLRFSPAETSDFLAASGIELSAETSSRLHARTEGWAAGLRLAALSLAGRADADRFVAEFSGSQRMVADYLLAEVLENQPEDVRSLLLRTSILSRVSGALADRMLGSAGSERILLRLEESNAFVSAVNPERTWFRYHQLFSELLRLELRRASPELIPNLHRDAAAWFAEHGEVIEAIRHLQAAEDWAAAGRLLSRHAIGLVLDGQGATVDALISAFPRDAIDDPELLTVVGYRELTERSLDVATQVLALADRRAAVLPSATRARVNVPLALARLALARRRGDLETALREVGPILEPVEATTSQELAVGGDVRAVALMNLGIVELWAARFDDAERHLEQGLALAREIGRVFVATACLSHLAVLVSTRSFTRARELADQALQLAEARGWATNPLVGPALAALASMDAAQGRFESAHVRLDRAAALLREEIDAGGAMFVNFIRGDLLGGEGRLSEAIDAYRSAQGLQPVLAARHVLTGPAQVFIALTQLRAGQADAARATIDALSDDERAGAEGRLAVAALQLADGAAAEVIATLDDVAFGSSAVLRVGTRVQALVLVAAAHDRLGHSATQQEFLERALDLAEPDALVLPFLTTPVPDLVELFERHPRHRTAHAALLADLIDILRGAGRGDGASRLEASRVAAPVEELSSTELRVLRYLPSNLSASEIAAELYVSTSTVKTHMRHIYDKLDAHRRTEAVERARGLGLLGPSAPRRG